MFMMKLSTNVKELMFEKKKIGIVSKFQVKLIKYQKIIYE